MCLTVSSDSLSPIGRLDELKSHTSLTRYGYPMIPIPMARRYGKPYYWPGQIVWVRRAEGQPSTKGRVLLLRGVYCDKTDTHYWVWVVAYLAPQEDGEICGEFRLSATTNPAIMPPLHILTYSGKDEVPEEDRQWMSNHLEPCSHMDPMDFECEPDPSNGRLENFTMRWKPTEFLETYSKC